MQELQILNDPNPTVITRWLSSC